MEERGQKGWVLDSQNCSAQKSWWDKITHNTVSNWEPYSSLKPRVLLKKDNLTTGWFWLKCKKREPFQPQAEAELASVLCWLFWLYKEINERGVVSSPWEPEVTEALCESQILHYFLGGWEPCSLSPSFKCSIFPKTSSEWPLYDITYQEHLWVCWEH